MIRVRTELTSRQRHTDDGLVSRTQPSSRECCVKGSVEKALNRGRLAECWSMTSLACHPNMNTL